MRAWCARATVVCRWRCCRSPCNDTPVEVEAEDWGDADAVMRWCDGRMCERLQGGSRRRVDHGNPCKTFQSSSRRSLVNEPRRHLTLNSTSLVVHATPLRYLTLPYRPHLTLHRPAISCVVTSTGLILLAAAVVIDAVLDLPPTALPLLPYCFHANLID